MEKPRREQSAEDDPLNAAWRHVSAMFAAFSLLGLLKHLNLLTWQKTVARWIDAFQAFTRPVATFLFGWLPALFGWQFPGWLKDYLVVGVIVFLALIRAYKAIDLRLTRMIGVIAKDLLICLLLWPVVVLRLLPPVLAMESRMFDGAIPKERVERVYRRKFLLFGQWVDELAPVPPEERQASQRRAARASFAMFVYLAAFIAANYALLVGGVLSGR